MSKCVGALLNVHQSHTLSNMKNKNKRKSLQE